MLTWYGSALLNSDDTKQRKEGASYLLKAALDGDIRSIRLLEAIDPAILESLIDIDAAAELVDKAVIKRKGQVFYVLQ